MLKLVVNGLLGATHEGEFVCIVPIDLTQLSWLVCAQWSVASRCIWLLNILGWLVFLGIIGNLWLLTASLQLVVSPVPSSAISTLPLLAVGG